MSDPNRSAILENRSVRRTCLSLAALHCFATAQAVAEPIEVVLNFDHFSALTTEQETELGVVTPPASAKEVASHNGIPIFETESRPFSQEEIDEIIRVLDAVPARMLESPPKAIVAASSETNGRIVRPNTVATASGPYIFLGTAFFEGSSGGFSSETTENDRLSIFMHEYAHVLQYYHLDPETGKQSNFSDSSSLVFDFATNVGWTAKTSVSGEYFEGDQIPFNSQSYIGWKLPEEQEINTTRYGRTNSVEDQAESFGWVIAGHPDYVSPDRVAYVLRYLDEPEETFTQGVVPLHPESLRGRGQPRGSQSFFQDMTPSAFGPEDDASSLHYFFDRESGITFDQAVAYFEQEMTERGFTVIDTISSTTLENNEDHASGVFEFEDTWVLFQIFDVLNAEKYITKGNITFRFVTKQN